MDRREFFKYGASMGLGFIAGNEAHSKNINKDNFEQYLKEGVQINKTTTTWLDIGGNPKTSSTVNLNLEQLSFEGMGNLEDKLKLLDFDQLSIVDSMNVKNMIKAFATDYTTIALVGSAASQKDDIYPNDIDLLILNGKDEVYKTPRVDNLFDNQIDNLFLTFRSMGESELIDFFENTDPLRAKKIKEKKHDRYDTLVQGFYTSNHVNYDSLPLHILSPKDSNECVANNLDLLKKSLVDGTAKILYQGSKSNLL